VQSIQTFSPDCVIDAGNATIVSLTDVKPAESIAGLLNLAREPRRGAHRSTWRAPAITAQIRGQTFGWLPQTAALHVSIPGHSGRNCEGSGRRYRRIPRDDEIPPLLELARSHVNGAVQKAAMRCLGRSKDERATKFCQEILSK